MEAAMGHEKASDDSDGDGDEEDEPKPKKKGKGGLFWQRGK